MSLAACWVWTCMTSGWMRWKLRQGRRRCILSRGRKLHHISWGNIVLFASNLSESFICVYKVCVSGCVLWLPSFHPSLSLSLSGCSTCCPVRTCFWCDTLSPCCTVSKATLRTTRWTPSTCPFASLPACFGLQRQAPLRWRARAPKRWGRACVLANEANIQGLQVVVFNRIVRHFGKYTYLLTD